MRRQREWCSAGSARVALGCASLLLAPLLATGCSEINAAATRQDGPDPEAAWEAREARPSRAARQAVRGAPDALAAAGSSRTRTAMSMASGGTRLTIRGEGRFDYRERIGRLRVTLPSDPGEADAAPVTEVFTSGVLYLKNRGAGVPPDKWVRMEIAELADGNLVTGGATDPLTAAELLRGARKVAELGRSELAGEEVRHFRGVADIAAAARAATEPAARDQLAAAVEGFTDTAVRFDAYLDGDGLLRKVRHRFRFASDAAQGAENAEGGGTSGGGSRRGRGAPPASIDVTSTVTLFEFGTPVRLTVPAPEDLYAGTVPTAPPDG